MVVDERERFSDRGRRYFIGDRLFSLPGVPAVEEGESIQSLIWRASTANSTNQRDTAIALTMPSREDLGIRYHLRSTYLMSPWYAYTPEQNRAVRGTFLASLATKCFRYLKEDSIQSAAHREAIRVSSTLICPQCLGESPAYYRLAWRVGAVFMCVKHKCLLVEKCDKCDLEHGKPRRDNRVIPTHGTRIGSTTWCMNPAPEGSKQAESKQPCGAYLPAIKTDEVEDAELAIAQAEILKVLASDGPFQVRPNEWMTALEFFDDLYHLCGLALFAAPVSSARGLGKKMEEEWQEHCASRAQNLAEREGQKGSLDRGMAEMPPPALMAVAVKVALPIVVAPSEVERRERLADLLGYVRQRQRRALDRARNEERQSLGLKLALVELTIRRNRILSYLWNHPLKGRALDLRHYDDEITPEMIANEFPALADLVNAAELVLPLQVMLRFFLSKSARSWKDVYHPDDPPSVASKVLRLVNLAGATGLSRQLARWVALTGVRDDDYQITVVRFLKEDGSAVTWQERSVTPHRVQGNGYPMVRRETRSAHDGSRIGKVTWNYR
jgi:hypothetical protein